MRGKQFGHGMQDLPKQTPQKEWEEEELEKPILEHRKKRKGSNQAKDAKTGIWNLQPLAKDFLYSTLQKVEWKSEQNLSSCSMKGNCLRGGCRNALSLWGPRRRHLSCDSPPLQTNVFAACHREMKRYSSEGGK